MIKKFNNRKSGLDLSWFELQSIMLMDIIKYIKKNYYANILLRYIMKSSKQHLKLNNLQVKAEKCLSRKEAKKIIIKAEKAQDKINK